MTLIDNILSPESIETNMPRNLRCLLTGRIFATCSHMADVVNAHQKETATFMNRAIAAAFKSLSEHRFSIAVKLSATRCIIKFLRRLPAESLPNSGLIRKGLTPLLELLQSASLDCVQLPVEAFATLSKFYDGSVTDFAHHATPRLLELFASYHSEGNLGNELISLFKIWCRFE